MALAPVQHSGVKRPAAQQLSPATQAKAQRLPEPSRPDQAESYTDDQAASGTGQLLLDATPSHVPGTHPLPHPVTAPSSAPATSPDELKTNDVEMARTTDGEPSPENRYGAKWAFTLNGKLRYFSDKHTLALEHAFLYWIEAVSLPGDDNTEQFSVDLTKMMVRLTREEDSTPAGTMCSVARHCSSKEWMTLRMPIAMVPTDHEIEPLQMLSRSYKVRLHYSANMVWLTGPNNAGDENGPVKTVERLVRSVLQKRQPSADWHFEVPRTKDSKSRYSAYTDVFMVPPESEEFKELAAKFADSLPLGSIVSIQRVQNLVLWRKFMHEREFLRMKGSPANELMLFYGTQRVNPVFIGHSEIGFDFRLSGDQNYWGRAMYFAASPGYADAYAYSATLRPDGTVDPGTVSTTTPTSASSATDQASSSSAASASGSSSSSSSSAQAPQASSGSASAAPATASSVSASAAPATSSSVSASAAPATSSSVSAPAPAASSSVSASAAPAASASASAPPTRSEQKEQPELLTKQLIVASVLIGEPYYGAPEGFVEAFRNLKRPPRKGGPKLAGTQEMDPAPPPSTSMPRSCFDEYDSVCGDVLKSRNYAVYAHHRAYPRYIVTYKAPPHIRVQPAAPLRTGPASSGASLSTINGPAALPSSSRLARSTSATSASSSSSTGSSPGSP